MCRQAGRDICHSADGQRGFGWSSWLGGVPCRPSVLLPELGETGSLLRQREAFLLFKEMLSGISQGVSFPVSRDPFTSICITLICYIINPTFPTANHPELWEAFLLYFLIWRCAIFNPRTDFCIRAHFSEGRFLAELPAS